MKQSERIVCRSLDIPRATLRYESRAKADTLIKSRIEHWALKYIRAGYRTVAALMRNCDKIAVNHKKVERIWRQTGLKQRRKHKRCRGILGEYVRVKPARRNHVWSYDFVSWNLLRGGKIRILNVIDEYTRECIAVLIKRSIKASDVEGVLAKLFVERGRPEYIRSDNGSEFTANALMKWLKALKVATLFIEPGSPWQNGFCESFNGKMRNECLNINVCGTVLEADYVIRDWVKYYNTIRPHSSLGGVPPAPEAVLPMFFRRFDVCPELH
jgi:transposase InsO family protein